MREFEIMKNIEKVVNLTPFTVRLKSGQIRYEIESSGQLRVEKAYPVYGKVRTPTMTVPISDPKLHKYDNVDLLAPKRSGTIYIVSKLVCQVYPHRDDFYVLADPVYSPGFEKRIIGSRSIAVNPFC